MVRKFIILGAINKKLLLPFVFSVSQIAYKMFNRYYPGKSNNIFNFFSISLGMISVILLPYILRIKIHENSKEKKIQKRKCLHYGILVFIFLVYIIMKTIPPFMKGDYAVRSQKSVNFFSEGAFLIMGIEMTLLAIFSYFILKYKYYKHHIISIVVFIICGICCDLFLNYYREMFDFGFLINFIEFLSIITDVFYYYYQKYMMERLFYPYWRIGFALGITYLCFNIALLIYVLTSNDKINSKDSLVKQFYYSLNDLDIGLLIGRLIIIFIFIATNTALNILIIYYYNPNYILISFQVSKIIQVLIDEDKEKFYCLFFFILQFLCLMIYLEILELNFCGLNKNTKRNIEFRGLEDLTQGSINERSSSVSFVEINNDYLIDSNNNIGNNIEMTSRTNSEFIAPGK